MNYHVKQKDQNHETNWNGSHFYYIIIIVQPFDGSIDRMMEGERVTVMLVAEELLQNQATLFQRLRGSALAKLCPQLCLGQSRFRGFPWRRFQRRDPFFGGFVRRLLQLLLFTIIKVVLIPIAVRVGFAFQRGRGCCLLWRQFWGRFRGKGRWSASLRGSATKHRLAQFGFQERHRRFGGWCRNRRTLRK